MNCVLCYYVTMHTFKKHKLGSVVTDCGHDNRDPVAGKGMDAYVTTFRPVVGSS